MRPLSASMGFGGSGFAGADAVPPPEGDDEQAIIARAAQNVRSVFQIVVIGANHTFKFSSDIQMVWPGIKLTTLSAEGLSQRRFTRKESSTLWLRMASIAKDSTTVCTGPV